MKFKTLKWKLLFILYFTALNIVSIAQESAVTYTFSGGRLGDNLLSLLHAEWISYKYDIPLLYKPFPYSDQLKVHDLRKHFNEQIIKQFKNKVELKTNEYMKYDKHASTLYTITYFPESMEEHRNDEFDSHAGKIKVRYPHFTVDWEDKGFLKRIREIIAPRHDFNLINPPQDCVSIAVQVRKNSGGFDLPLLNELPEKDYNPSTIYVDRVFPLKHPANKYYIDQIKLLLSLFQGKKAYIFIFTDDPNPERIVKLYSESITQENVIFDYRKSENNHYSNVLEDFFSMQNFDCLIRPDSNLTIAASKIGNFKIVISPVTHRWENTKLIIEKVSILMRQ